MKTLKKYKTVMIITLIGLLSTYLYALNFENVFLKWVDSVSLVSYILLLIGVIRWGWIKGDFAYFSFNPYKPKSFTTHRLELEDSRKHKKNPILISGIILLVISLIASNIYMKSRGYY